MNNKIILGAGLASSRTLHLSGLGVASFPQGPDTMSSRGSFDSVWGSGRTDGSKHCPRSRACWLSKGTQRQGSLGFSARNSTRLTVVASLLTLMVEALENLRGRRSSSESSEGRESEPDRERRLRW
jgi:hypothetical protein